MPIIDHFGIFAPFYERVFPAKENGTLALLSDLPVSGALLDAGGGTGRIAQTLRGKAAQIVVADISTRMLQQARRKKGLECVCTFTEVLPFQDGAFERIIMVDAFHHIVNHRQTAHELWRVLKPGGRIVIEEMDFRTVFVKLVAVMEKVALMRSHFLKPDQIAVLFKFYGADIRIEKEGYNSWIIIQKT